MLRLPAGVKNFLIVLGSTFADFISRLMPILIINMMNDYIKLKRNNIIESIDAAA